MKRRDSNKEDDVKRSVRSSNREVDVLLNRLDDDGIIRKGTTRRVHERYEYRLQNCRVRLQQPGDLLPVRFDAPTRNLSAGGIAFLHGGFVHNGTRCWVTLVTQRGATVEVRGEVVACRFLESTSHEVCVRFDTELQPGDFCDAAISFNVLVAEDDPAMAKLTRHHLEKLGAMVTVAENGRVAVDLAMSSHFDCILMDMDMPVLDGFEATKELRSKNYGGVIVACTGMARPEDREKCLRSGCSHFLEKPGSQEKFQAVLDALKCDPVMSIHHTDPTMANMIIAFIDSLPATIRELEEGMDGPDYGSLSTVCRTLKSAADGHGFATIADTASLLEDAAINELPQKLLRFHFEELLRLCMMTRKPLAA